LDAAMFRLAADAQVYLHREAIDFRIGINGLAILVEQSMHLNPFGRAVFAFCNRRRDRIRLLFYDRSGFWLRLTPTILGGLVAGAPR
jgi:transposase